MKLKNVCSYITDGSHYSPISVEEGLPIASVKDMNDYGILTDTCRKISKEEFDNLVLNKCKPEVGDVLIAKDGSYLKHAFVVEKEPDYVILSSIGLFRPNLKIMNSYYLKYMFLNERFRDYVMRGFVTGTALKRIVLKAFKEINITVPSIEMQEKIVRKIKPIDDKIKKNLILIDSIEQYSELLFYKWFVKFNYPDERGLQFKDNGGDMIDIDGKIIPKGWKRGTFKDILSVSSGKRPNMFMENSTDEYHIPVYGASKIMGFTDEVLYDEHVIITGRVGTHGVLMRERKPCWASDNTLVIKSKFYEFTYQTLNRFDFTKLNIGSSQPLITQKDLSRQKSTIPTREMIEKFETTVGPFMKKSDSLKDENKLLEETRALLIKKLII